MSRKEALVRLVAGANGFGAFANDEPARLVRWCVDQLAEIEKVCPEETPRPGEVFTINDVRGAVASQREKDAEIAKSFAVTSRPDDLAGAIAAAIRAGGQ